MWNRWRIAARQENAGFGESSRTPLRITGHFAYFLLCEASHKRKNSLFYRSEIGAGVSDVITSVLATCRENDVNGFDYLVALQRHQERVRRSPESWLPWNYEAAVAELNGSTGATAAAA